jgi:tetratricopeptide (TPR) repeat protein
MPRKRKSKSKDLLIESSTLDWSALQMKDKESIHVWRRRFVRDKSCMEQIIPDLKQNPCSYPRFYCDETEIVIQMLQSNDYIESTVFWYWIGDILKHIHRKNGHQNLPEKALLAYDQANFHSKTVKDKAMSFVKMAECCWEWSCFNKAADFFQEAWKNSKYLKNGLIQSAYGDCFLDQQKHEEALEMYTEALDHLPEEYRELRMKIYHKMGRIYLYTYNRIQDAYESYKKFDEIAFQYPDEMLDKRELTDIYKVLSNLCNILGKHEEEDIHSRKYFKLYGSKVIEPMSMEQQVKQAVNISKGLEEQFHNENREDLKNGHQIFNEAQNERKLKLYHQSIISYMKAIRCFKVKKTTFVDHLIPPLFFRPTFISPCRALYDFTLAL